jgi:hypothetical protein
VKKCCVVGIIGPYFGDLESHVQLSSKNVGCYCYGEFYFGDASAAVKESGVGSDADTKCVQTVIAAEAGWIESVILGVNYYSEKKNSCEIVAHPPPPPLLSPGNRYIRPEQV